jgi:hypothetical protein
MACSPEGAVAAREALLGNIRLQAELCGYLEATIKVLEEQRKDGLNAVRLSDHAIIGAALLTMPVNSFFPMVPRLPGLLANTKQQS